MRKAGHCEHFATALTLMLRTQGFEARLATGFFGGERVGDEYIVRAGDAHAWTHVLVPGRGFVTVDATPPAFRANQSPQLLESLISIYEAIEGRGARRVVDYSFRDQMNFMRDLTRPPKQPEGQERLKLPPLRAWLTAAAGGLRRVPGVALLLAAQAPGADAGRPRASWTRWSASSRR